MEMLRSVIKIRWPIEQFTATIRPGFSEPLTRAIYATPKGHIHLLNLQNEPNRTAIESNRSIIPLTQTLIPDHGIPLVCHIS